MVARRREGAKRREAETSQERWQRVRSERRALLYGPLPERDRCAELLELHERQVLRERDWARACIRDSSGKVSDWTPLVFSTYPDLDPTNGETREHFRSFDSSRWQSAPRRKR